MCDFKCNGFADVTLCSIGGYFCTNARRVAREAAVAEPARSRGRMTGPRSRVGRGDKCVSAPSRLVSGLAVVTRVDTNIARDVFLFVVTFCFVVQCMCT